MKTENATLVGKHAFEVAGLGLAPFVFIGVSENVITYPDGSQQAGGTCDFCGNGIKTECHVRSADGKQFKVGCNCIEKVGDKGVLEAYKNSPEYRRHQRELRQKREVAREDAAKVELEDLEVRYEFSKYPHPHGFRNRETGELMTAEDAISWTLSNRGFQHARNQAKYLVQKHAMIPRTP